uniref:Thioredoxin domain-containing protein n=1 Tax=Opuntia streptacantha TaxID=393608 RepID=A0A7C8YF25_OPUST
MKLKHELEIGRPGPKSSVLGSTSIGATMADRRFVMILSLCLFLFLLMNLVPSNADVVTLTEDIFSDKIKEKDTAWFVQFCVPWCKHCKNLGSLWEDLGKAMEGEDEIEIGQVDCSVSKPVCSKVDIHSYPTFKLFYNGEEVAKYQGPRDVELLKAFVLEETEKAAAKAQDDSEKDL